MAACVQGYLARCREPWNRFANFKRGSAFGEPKETRDVGGPVKGQITDDISCFVLPGIIAVSNEQNVNNDMHRVWDVSM